MSSNLTPSASPQMSNRRKVPPHFLATPLIARFRNFFSVASTEFAGGSANVASGLASDLAEDVRINRFGLPGAFLGGNG